MTTVVLSVAGVALATLYVAPVFWLTIAAAAGGRRARAYGVAAFVLFVVPVGLIAAAQS